MKYGLFDSQGNRISGGLTGPTGTPSPGGTGSSTGGNVATYDRMDVGILYLNQTFQQDDIYDFRVPGDVFNTTFRYRFPRNGYVLGATISGDTSGQTITGGIYVTRYDHVADQYTDVLTPTDPGNTQTIDPSAFAKSGIIIWAPTPIPYSKDDAAALKFQMTSIQTVTLNLNGFILVALQPQ